MRPLQTNINKHLTTLINRLPKQEKDVLVHLYVDELELVECSIVLCLPIARIIEIRSSAMARLNGMIDKIFDSRLPGDHLYPVK